MSKTIYFAGVSRVAGELKFRTAADDKRMAQLVKLGDTDVEMVNLRAETKVEAAQELLSRNFANGRADIQALLESVAGKVTKTKRQVKVTVPTRFAQEMLGAKVKVEAIKKEPKLSIEEANARVMATAKEITPERALELLVRAMPKKRRSRRTQVETN
jgi:hypothetical protein